MHKLLDILKKLWVWHVMYYIRQYHPKKLYRKWKEKRILKKHPLFFRQYFHEDIYTSCMPWGFECGPGWLAIIDKLADEMEAYNELHSNQPPVEACQIKEKFGDLRVYVDNATKEAYQILQKYEWMAEETCEYCGSTKEVSKTTCGWITNLCEKCHKKQLKGKQNA